jgi:hypothetical protein
LTYCNVHLAFKRIVAHAGLTPRSTVCRPRPHDLRHAFAVNTLLDAYRDDRGDGEHIGARIALLCTYLGHVNPDRRIGTCRPPRNCSRSPPTDSSSPRRARDEPARTDAAGVLH